MKYHISPLSKTMIEKLKICRQIELYGEKNKPCTLEDVHYSVAPLYKRGMIEIRKNAVEGKELYCVYVTETGKDFLLRLEKEENKSLVLNITLPV